MELVKQTVLNYSGEFTFETTEKLLKEVKDKMNDFNIQGVFSKKIYNVMAETIENIFKYSDHKEKKGENFDQKFNPKIILEIADVEDGKAIFITAGNPILNYKINSLKNRIEYINKHNEKGLPKLYKHIIDGGDINDRGLVIFGITIIKPKKNNKDIVSSKGGAGLGLIDIAMKSNSNLYCSFVPIDNEFSFYELQIKFQIQLKTK